MSPSPKLVSKCMIYPTQKSTLEDLKLSVSDLPMVSCQYIQKGVLLNSPSFSSQLLLSLLKSSLSHTLVHFPPLAGRFFTDSEGHVFITCNDAGVEFIHADASDVTIDDLLSPVDVPDSFRKFFTFAFDGSISYNGHFHSLLAVQVTELADGVFIGCAVNHAVTDGTSFWNFFNTFAEVCKAGGAVKRISRTPDFTRNFFGESKAVLEFPEGGPNVTFSGGQIRERIFRFSREAILKLKSHANGWNSRRGAVDNGKDYSGTETEILGKQSNDNWKIRCQKGVDRTVEISSFMSLCAQLWRSVTRARELSATLNTTFRMAVNCRHRLEPRIDPLYFGNAIQSISTVASVGDILSCDLSWSASLLNMNVMAHNDATVRRGVKDWEREPKCFPLGNFDEASITMGSSPRFPMYDNDFGWGRPVAVRSGQANKFDGKMSAFPSREDGGSVDLEVCLASDTMNALEADVEFMQYVTE